MPALKSFTIIRGMVAREADKNDGTGHCNEVKYDVEVTKYVSEDGAFLQLVLQIVGQQ